MRVPVLLALPAQEPLRESASASVSGRLPTIPLTATRTPENFRLDETFAAVPLGSASAGFTTLEAVGTEESEDFAIRGTIEVETAEQIPDTLDGAPVFSDPMIAPFPYCAAGTQGTYNDVKAKLNVAGLQAKGLDGSNVAIAIVDTGINLAHLMSKLGSVPRLDASNSWKPVAASANPGQYPVDHGTMCAFDALIGAPNATILDYPVLATNVPGGNVSGRTISVALQAFSNLLANFAVAFAPGGTSKYSSLVISNSWGIYHPSWDFPVNHPGRYCDNPKHPFAAIVQALTSVGVDIVFAAGNCGADCPDGRCKGRSTGTIMGASAYADVMTVAACLVTNDDRLGYSSQGPSISGMPAQEKPDITAYAHFLGSEAFGSGSPDSGTSTACPVVAGCIAAIRTKLPASNTPPANLISQFQLMARQKAGTPVGWNADYGHGIIDPLNTAVSLGL